jgi:hypothetical protein
MFPGRFVGVVLHNFFIGGFCITLIAILPRRSTGFFPQCPAMSKKVHVCAGE